jgi:hypothetical protein
MADKVKIKRGEDKSFTVLLKREVCGPDDTEPFDLTGVSEITAKFRKEDSTVLEKTLSASGVEVVQALLGKAKIILTDVDTGLMETGDAQGFDLVVDYGAATGGTRRIFSFEESLDISDPLIV